MDVLDYNMRDMQIKPEMNIMKTTVALKAVGDRRKKIILLYVCGVYYL